MGFDAGIIDIDMGFDAGIVDFDMGSDAGMMDVDMGVDAGSIDIDMGFDSGPGDSDLGVDAGMMIVDMGVDAGTRVPGDVCETAIVVGAGTTSGTLSGARNDYGSGTSCVGASGPDLVYAIEVPAGFAATISVSPVSSSFDPSISLVAASACSATPRVCLAGDDSGGASATNVVRFRNDAATATRVLAVIDTASVSGGSFSLGVALAAIPEGDVCASAIPLAVGTTTGNTSAATNDYGSGTSCTGTQGSDLAYALTVPPGERAIVSVTSADGLFNPSIALVAGPADRCAATPRTCIASSDGATATTLDTVRYTNEGTAPVTLFAIVDSGSATTRGAFTLSFTTETPIAGDVCASATPIDVGTTMGTTVGSSNDYGGGSGCAGTQGADVAYAIEVPPGLRALVSVVGRDGVFDPSPSLIDGPATACGSTPRVCVASSSVTGAGATDTARFANPGSTPRVLHAIVDSASPTATGPFAITVAFDTPLLGDECALPERVGPGTYTGTLDGYARNFGFGLACETHDGADRVYAITLGVGQTLTATATTSAFDLVLNLESPCGASPRACLDGSDLTVSGSETVTYTNPGTAPLDVFVVVDSFSASMTGDYTLDVRITP
jgi:hypothetical protein